MFSVYYTFVKFLELLVYVPQVIFLLSCLLLRFLGFLGILVTNSLVTFANIFFKLFKALF